jgi:hypothetical protein
MAARRNSPNGNMSNARAVRAALREQQILEMRLAGRTFRQIADALGYKTVSGAYSALQRALARTIQEPADAVRRLEVERLDRMIELLWADAHDPAARPGARLFIFDRILAVMDRRARYLGLDAPQKVDVQHDVRAIAESLGLDAAEAVRIAEQVDRELREASR